MPLSGARRVLVAALAAITVTAATVAITVDREAPREHRSPVARAPGPSSAVAYDLATALSSTSAVRTGPGTHDSGTLERVAEQEDVDPRRAWPVQVPGDDRTAWLFAGPGRVALVVPRPGVDDEGGPQRDRFSIFGTRIVDLADRPLVASQVGEGRARVIVLVPPGVAPPRIVARGRDDDPVREMPRHGRLYAARVRPGEEVVVGDRRIGPGAS